MPLGLLLSLACVALLFCMVACQSAEQSAESGAASSQGAAASISASSSSGESASSEGPSAQTAATRHVSEAAADRADSYTNALDGKALEVSIADASLHDVVKADTAKPESKHYTLMVYMIGSNLESANAAASADLDEMLESGVDFSDVNVVVYAGGSKRWNSDVPAGCNSVLDLSRAESDRVVAQTETDVSMGASNTLAAFVDYCAKRYPAEHNALVFWDHGGGPLWGFGLDELNGGDGLLLQELRQAMEATRYAAGSKKKLDWVGFDACLMGSIENVALWKDYAGYLVASEEVEPGEGWDYAFLPKLAREDDARAVCSSIVDAYAAFYEKKASAFSNPDVTLACYDLSKADDMLAAFNGLLSKMTEAIESGGYGDISRARRSSKAFGLSASGGRAAGYDLIDLADFAEKVGEPFAGEASALKAALGDVVAHGAANVERASGMSCYIPGDNRELFEAYSQLGELAKGAGTKEAGGADEGKEDAEASEASEAGGLSGSSVGKSSASAEPATIAEPSRVSQEHSKFIDSLADAWLDTSNVDWSVPPVATSAEGLSLQLTEEQAGALSSATYTLFSYENLGEYSMVMGDVTVSLDDARTMHVPADPLIIALKTDIGRDVLSHFVQVEETAGKGVFVDSTLSLKAVGDFLGDEALGERFTVTVQTDVATGDVSISSIRIDDDSVGVGGKGTVDVSDYSHAVVPQISSLPSFDADGDMLPWDEWQETSSWGAYYAPLEQGFGFSMLPASHFGGKWACQIVLTDVNGDRHALEPVELPINEEESKGESTVERDTDLGKMTFTVFGDHAELTKYDGDDWTLDIPTEVEGVQVTAIGNSAFEGCLHLDELVIPEGIVSIGQSAFERTGLYAITLPASLQHIAPAAFNEMPYLEAFALAGESSAATVVDGVLFSTDGATLLAYPNAKGAKYSVPKGVQTIGYGSFAGSDIEEVDFPEGLKKIDRAAFFGCKSLRSVELPDSLEEIGAAAFGVNRSWGDEDNRAQVDRVRIGPNVKRIGARAFWGLALSSIEVDERNASYTSREGVLLNAAGDTLLEIPSGQGLVFSVPEGVVALDDFAFSDLPMSGVDFVLPASLERCELTCFPSSRDIDSGELEYLNAIHAPEGSFALRFAEEYGMQHDSNTDVDSLRHEDVVSEQDGYGLTFSVYRDHAVLKGVDSDLGEGAAEHTLAIPNKVEGVPVTGLDTYYALDSNVATLVLPSSIESISGRSFVNATNLKRFELDGRSEHFQVVDGALLTSDGETLIAFPGGWEGGFAIPDGVETIGEYALNRCVLKSVELPSSVREISGFAFGDCENLEHVGFNRGLEVIGEHAFDGCKKLRIDEAFPDTLIEIGRGAFSGVGSLEGLALPDGIERIAPEAFSWGFSVYDDNRTLLDVSSGVVSIGSYVEQLGKDADSAFQGVGFERFEVAENNDRYRGEGPFLLTKDGTIVAGFADGYSGEARIPDSVRSVDGRLFENACRVTDLYIPDSVVKIRWPKIESDNDYHGSLRSIVIHVPAGSYAERFAKERDLPWVVD